MKRLALLTAFAAIGFAALADAGPLRRAAQRIRFGPPVVIVETVEPPLAGFCPCGPNCPCAVQPARFISPAPEPMPQKPGVAPVETKPQPPAKPPAVAQAPIQFAPYCTGPNCNASPPRRFRFLQ